MKNGKYEIGDKVRVERDDAEVMRRAFDVLLLRRACGSLEVVRVAWQDAGVRIMDGQEIEIKEGERLPSTSQWGKRGFTFCRDDMAGARRKFEEMANEVQS